MIFRFKRSANGRDEHGRTSEEAFMDYIKGRLLVALGRIEKPKKMSELERIWNSEVYAELDLMACYPRFSAILNSGDTRWAEVRTLIKELEDLKGESISEICAPPKPLKDLDHIWDRLPPRHNILGAIESRTGTENIHSPVRRVVNLEHSRLEKAYLAAKIGLKKNWDEHKPLQFLPLSILFIVASFVFESRFVSNLWLFLGLMSSPLPFVLEALFAFLLHLIVPPKKDLFP